MHWSRVNVHVNIYSVTDSVGLIPYSTYQCVFCSKGTYVLQDNNFQLLTQMSDGKQYTEDAPKVWKSFFCNFLFF